MLQIVHLLRVQQDRRIQPENQKVACLSLAQIRRSLSVMAIVARHLSASAQKHGPMVAVAPSQNLALQPKGVMATPPILAKTEIIWTTHAAGTKTHVFKIGIAGPKVAEMGIVARECGVSGEITLGTRA